MNGHSGSNGVSYENGGSGDEGWTKSIDPHFGTLAIHSGYKPSDAAYSPVVPPISLATTYEQDEPGKHRGFEYSRSGNPNRKILEDTIAALDKGKYGMCFGSGLAATSNVISLLKTGDHVICVDDVYGGSGRLLRQYAKSMGIIPEFIDCRNVDKLKNALKPSTKLVWIETPTNPTLKIIDIAQVSKIAHEFNKEIIVAVDNTFLTSFFQRPLELGADIVVYSLTKYMNGHSDVLMGALVVNDKDLYDRLYFLQYAIGAVPSPFDCFLVSRSLKTLHVRMPLHSSNALSVATFLEKHPKVERVLHPGLKSHPQHELALQQSGGHSGLISFYLKEGGDSVKFLQNLKLFSLAESLGGYESLAETPYNMTHGSVPEELRQELGITANFIRLSIGLESIGDILQDLDTALKNA